MPDARRASFIQALRLKAQAQDLVAASSSSVRLADQRRVHAHAVRLPHLQKRADRPDRGRLLLRHR